MSRTIAQEELEQLKSDLEAVNSASELLDYVCANHAHAIDDLVPRVLNIREDLAWIVGKLEQLKRKLVFAESTAERRTP